jgi:hypothetical protein
MKFTGMLSAAKQSLPLTRQYTEALHSRIDLVESGEKTSEQSVNTEPGKKTFKKQVSLCLY